MDAMGMWLALVIMLVGFALIVWAAVWVVRALGLGPRSGSQPPPTRKTNDGGSD